MTHLEESIQQILCTTVGERVMEYDFGSTIDSSIFDPNTQPTHNIIKYEAVEALTKLEPRIRVTMDDINIYAEDSNVYADVTYEVISYGITATSKIYIGGARSSE